MVIIRIKRFFRKIKNKILDSYEKMIEKQGK
jgi:hypothetical protein